MNIEEFRTYCLSFKGVHDKMPFEKVTSEYDRNLLVFYVVDKWFCFVNVDAFDFCNIKCKPEQIEELQDKYEGVDEMKMYNGCIPACGVFCGGCPRYLQERNSCAGADLNKARCEKCKTFHLCCVEKGITHCYQCNTFPCARFKSFAKRWLNNRN